MCKAWYTQTPTHALCFMCHIYRLSLTNKLCSMSSPPILLVSVDRDEQTVHDINAAYGLDLRDRYNLSPCCCYYRFLLGYLSLLSSVLGKPRLICTPVICSLMSLTCFVRTTVHSQTGTAPPLYFQGLAASWWWEVRSCYCLWTSRCRRGLGKVMFSFVSVISGVLNMGTLHNGFKCLPGKMD